MGRWLIAVALAALLLAGGAAAQDRFPGAESDLPPQSDGWSAAGLAVVQAWSEQIHSTALMVVHHGAVVVAWGDTTRRTQLASVRKSLLSALIGIAVAEHKIALDTTLAALGIDDNPPPLTAIEKQATVRMLLEARSGIYHPALYETRAMAAARPLRGSHDPGTFWYYNNWDFNTLGTIYEHATGLGIYEALDRKIARPIGMQDYRPEDGRYVTGPDSIHPAYPLLMSARDLARFGLLYLHRGAWAGRQLVPAEWVDESTRAYSHATRGMGYGYLWWTEPWPGVALPSGSFFAQGHGGQFAFVIPADDLVIVNREDSDEDLPEPRIEDVAQLLRLLLQAGGFPA